MYLQELSAVRSEAVAKIPWTSYLSVLVSLLTSTLGGLLCGLVSGLTASLVSRATSHSSRHLEILVSTASVVLGYLLSAKLGWDWDGVWMHVDMAAPAYTGDRATG